MSTRILAAIAATGLCTAATVGIQQPAAHAERPIPGTGPCLTDPRHQHEPIVPKTLEVPVPYPAVTAVPFPAPGNKPTRIAQTLPADTCVNPCPDLTDRPAPPPGLLDSLPIPKLIVRPTPFWFGFPQPGPPPQPPPGAVRPGTAPAPQQPAPPRKRAGHATEVAKLTGALSVNRTDKRWQVQGTDLGIMWESKPGQVAIAFGDTVGRDFHPPGGMGEDWRSNVLGFSSNRDLGRGVIIDRMVTDSRCHAAEVLDSRKMDNIEITTIPTSGFALGKRQFMSYMSIRTWNTAPGSFFTNHGGLAYSDDGGQVWKKDPHARWDNIFGISNFQVSAMVPDGDYVYMFGTPNTRLGNVGLARVAKRDVLNTTAYQYWVNGQWTPVGGPAAATPVVQGPAGELSVRYDATRKMWQMTYLDTARTAIVMREAATPQGHWSEPVPLVGVDRYPELYGGFMHPWSTGRDLYYAISTWSDYNVYLMHTTLD